MVIKNNVPIVEESVRQLAKGRERKGEKGLSCFRSAEYFFALCNLGVSFFWRL